MSYILDALKRAERERKQGQVSVLDEIPAAPTVEPRRRLPPLLIPAAAGVVLLGALVYGLLAWRHHGSAAPAATAHPPLAPAPPPALAASPPPQAAPPPPGPSATIEDGVRLNSLDDMQAPNQPPAPPPADEPAPPPGPPPGAMLARRRPPPAQQAPAEAPPAADSPPQDVPPPADAEPAAPAAPAAAPPAAADHQLQEMPENFRAGFPAISVDVHVYNSDPQRRFVLIGGKRYHEGDTLAEGPRIAGIVPEGIVFDWQGQRVLYAISH